jgi:hypothetical protein
MAYTPTTWLEQMPSAQKLTALDNLEAMYSGALDYIDAITHGERYYTDSQASSKYFSQATDGSGSGLICATLDGYSAQQIIDAGAPSGCITLWSGTIESIPTGWYLCNGSNGTPNLRDRFVVSAGNNYARGSFGGSVNATPSGTVTIGTHALTVDEIPPHTHQYYDYYRLSSGGAGSYYIAPSFDVLSTTIAGTSTAHGHIGSMFTGAAGSILPSYYALCFIMRS